MTEPLPPLSDEDLSAVLDGEAAADVTERARTDPAARARIDAFRTAGDSLRAAPVPLLDSSVVDDLVGRALGQAGTEAPSTAGPDPVAADHGAIGGVHQDASASTSTSTDDVIVPLPPRRGRSTGPSRWLVAAAIVVVVAIGLGLIWSGRDGGDSETAGRTAAGMPQDDESGGGGAGEATAAESGVAAEDDGRSDNVPTTTAPAAEVPTPTVGGTTSSDPTSGLTDLGTFAALEDLRTALAVSFPSDRLPLGPGAGPSATAIDRCELLMMEVFELPTGATQVGQATIGGEDLLVFEFDAPSVQDGSPTTFLTVNEPTSCDARLSFERATG